MVLVFGRLREECSTPLGMDIILGTLRNAKQGQCSDEIEFRTNKRLSYLQRNTHTHTNTHRQTNARDIKGQKIARNETFPIHAKTMTKSIAGINQNKCLA